MGRYFNVNEEFGKHFSGTLRLQDAGGGDAPEGNGWQVMKGGMVNGKGKLIQADVIAYCETKAEAEELIRKLVEL